MASESPNRIVNIDGRRRRPWALTSQENLLNAAVEEIAAVGFAKARLSDIAKRAGMTAGSVYTWFEDKEDLFQAALKHALAEQLRSNIEKLSEADIQHTYLRQIAEIAPRNYQDQGPTAAQQLLIECYYAAWREPKVRDRLLEGLDEHRQMYVDILIGARNEGVLDEAIDPESLATLLLAVHLGMATVVLAGVPRISDSQWLLIVSRMLNSFRP